MKRSLHIADPCTESWEAMPGTEERRFCGKCGKDVHAISELSRGEAERVLDLARSGRLCVRVEHRADGAVHFKREDAVGGGRHRGALVGAAVGASLLVASCSPAEPVMMLDLPGIRPDSFTQEAAPQANAPPSAIDKGDKEACPPPGGELPAGAEKGKPTAKDGSKDAQTDRKVTMGCVCVPGDTLCDCL